MTPPDDIEEMDPGLARERTELAWTRTAISFAALGAAVLRATPVVGALILAMSGLVYVLGRAARPSHRHRGRDRGRPLLLISVAVTVVALVALALAVFGQGHPVRLG